MKKVALYGGLLALVGVSAAYGAGQFPGYPLATAPLSGFEYVPADTGDVATMATFTGSISGTTLTISSLTSGSVYAGQNLQGANIAPGTVIVSGSGLSWTVNNSQTVSSTTITSGGGGVNPQTEVIQTQQLRAYILNGSASTSSYVRTAPVTIATLPSCVAALNGARAAVSDGVAYSLTLAAAGAIGTAVGSSTGTVTRTVLCGSTNQSSFAWVYN